MCIYIFLHIHVHMDLTSPVIHYSRQPPAAVALAPLHGEQPRIWSRYVHVGPWETHDSMGYTHTRIYIYIDLSIYLFIMLYPQPRKNAARGGLKRKQSVHKGNKATLVVTVSLLLKPTDLSALTNHPAPLPAQQPSRLYHKAKNCHKHKLTPFH